MGDFSVVVLSAADAIVHCADVLNRGYSMSPLRSMVLQDEADSFSLSPVSSQVHHFMQACDVWIDGEGSLHDMARAVGVSRSWLLSYLYEVSLCTVHGEPAPGATTERVLSVLTLYWLARIMTGKR